MNRFIISLVLLGSSFSSMSDPLEYNRVKLFGSWKDYDKDCQSTRTEVLIRDSLVPVTMNVKGCKVTAGLWLDPYLGIIIDTVKDVDIEHIVPLEEAYRSGAYLWSKDKRQQYANSMDGLIVSHYSSNRSKKSKDPKDWMPSNRAYWKTYLSKWVKIKQQWKLSFDREEYNTVKALWKSSNKYKRGDTTPMQGL